MEANEMLELKELIEFLKANEIAEFELDKDLLHVKLKFASAIQPVAAAVPAGMDMAALARALAGAGAGQPGQSAAIHAVAETTSPAVPEVKHHVLKSPIVGTFYDAPSPGSPPFVKVGDIVDVGHVLCIVEAMKLMNEIESDAAGEVVERIAIAGQPVEYGQPLFSIKVK